MARKRRSKTASNREPFGGTITLEGVRVSLPYERWFQDDQRAWDFLEKRRWPKGDVGRHCRGTKSYRLKRLGFYRCAGCQRDFSITGGTIMERSHIPLHKWLIALYLMATGYKVRVEQLRWALDVTYPTAWKLWHRIEALKERRGEDTSDGPHAEEKIPAAAEENIARPRPGKPGPPRNIYTAVMENYRRRYPKIR